MGLDISRCISYLRNERPLLDITLGQPAGLQIGRHPAQAPDGEKDKRNEVVLADIFSSSAKNK
jgi:hypothetical protein